MKIYGGTASSEPLNSGVDTDTFAQSDVHSSDATEDPDNVPDNSMLQCVVVTQDCVLQCIDVSQDSTSIPAPAPRKRLLDDSCVKLIDNKRKHMERTLSAA